MTELLTKHQDVLVEDRLTRLSMQERAERELYDKLVRNEPALAGGVIKYDIPDICSKEKDLHTVIAQADIPGPKFIVSTSITQARQMNWNGVPRREVTAEKIREMFSDSNMKKLYNGLVAEETTKKTEVHFLVYSINEMIRLVEANDVDLRYHLGMNFQNIKSRDRSWVSLYLIMKRDIPTNNKKVKLLRLVETAIGSSKFSIYPSVSGYCATYFGVADEHLKNCGIVDELVALTVKYKNLLYEKQQIINLSSLGGSSGLYYIERLSSGGTSAAPYKAVLVDRRRKVFILDDGYYINTAEWAIFSSLASGRLESIEFPSGKVNIFREGDEELIGTFSIPRLEYLRSPSTITSIRDLKTVNVIVQDSSSGSKKHTIPLLQAVSRTDCLTNINIFDDKFSGDQIVALMKMLLKEIYSLLVTFNPVPAICHIRDEELGFDYGDTNSTLRHKYLEVCGDYREGVACELERRLITQKELQQKVLNSLYGVSREITHIENGLAKLKSTGNDVVLQINTREFDKLMMLSKVHKVSITNKRHLIVVTNPLFCRDTRTGLLHFIGKIVIDVDMHRGLGYVQGAVYNRIRCQAHDAGLLCPHGNVRGDICYGNAEVALTQLLARNKYAEFIGRYIKFLESSNKMDTWGRRVVLWPAVDESSGKFLSGWENGKTIKEFAWWWYLEVGDSGILKAYNGVSFHHTAIVAEAYEWFSDNYLSVMEATDKKKIADRLNDTELGNKIRSNLPDTYKLLMEKLLK